MGILEKILAAVLLLIAPSTAHVISLKLRYDKRHLIPFSDFEFSTAGYVSLMISSVTLVSTTSSPPDPSRIGFILQQRQVRNETRLKFEANNTLCALDFELNTVLFTFQNLSHSSFNKSFPVTYSGMYSLFFVNCNPESFVTIDGRAQLYNIDDDGTTRNYLSAGLTDFPFLSFIFSIIYLSFLGIWILVGFRNRRYFRRIHLLMGGLLVINFVYFIIVGVDLLHVKAAGSADGLDVLFCIFQLSRDVLLFSVILLTYAGWSMWKRYFLAEDLAFLTNVIVFQVWANVNPMLAWEDPVSYYIKTESLPDYVCCSLIVVYMTMSARLLFPTQVNAYRNSKHFYLFNKPFHKLYSVYIVITRVILFQLSTRWMKYAVKEASTLVLHIIMFYMFRPVDHRMRW